LYTYCQGDPIDFIDSSGLAVLPADFIGPLQPGDCRGAVPTKPPGVLMSRNIQIAQKHKGDAFWFKNTVGPNRPWDYKRRGGQYEAFGNFNYGATGAAAGIPDWMLLKY